MNEPTQDAQQPDPEKEHKRLLKKAMKAFRKRLRLTQLDDESKLGGGAFSGGKSSGIVAIRPPDDFPQEVWDELVEKGRLKTERPGLYELNEP